MFLCFHMMYSLNRMNRNDRIERAKLLAEIMSKMKGRELAFTRDITMSSMQEDCIIMKSGSKIEYTTLGNVTLRILLNNINAHLSMRRGSSITELSVGDKVVLEVKVRMGEDKPKTKKVEADIVGFSKGKVFFTPRMFGEDVWGYGRKATSYFRRKFKSGQNTFWFNDKDCDMDLFTKMRP